MAFFTYIVPAKGSEDPSALTSRGVRFYEMDQGFLHPAEFFRIDISHSSDKSFAAQYADLHEHCPSMTAAEHEVMEPAPAFILCRNWNAEEQFAAELLQDDDRAYENFMFPVVLGPDILTEA